jgi:hypothetical protein
MAAEEAYFKKIGGERWPRRERLFHALEAALKVMK